MKRIIVGLITIYQKTLSPDHGLFRGRYPYGFCKYYPSCSEFTKQAVESQGVVLGLGLGLIRVIKCNPWSKGGIDKVNSHV